MLVDLRSAPRHETPNAVMRTLAAPSLGSTDLAVWHVSMDAGQQGPDHSVNREQVWVVLEGHLDVQVAGESRCLKEGAALRIPPDVARQVTARTRTHAWWPAARDVWLRPSVARNAPFRGRVRRSTWMTR